jgi:flagellar hook-basal body complex protein FliE
MDVKTTNAALAYTEALSRAAKSGVAGGVSAVPETSFSDMVREFTGDAVAALETNEKVSMMGAEAKVELVDLVTATTNAQMTLDLVVTLRDRVMAAYQEIIKMPI